jgi:hypothetical protein
VAGNVPDGAPEGLQGFFQQPGVQVDMARRDSIVSGREDQSGANSGKRNKRRKKCFRTIKSSTFTAT